MNTQITNPIDKQFQAVVILSSTLFFTSIVTLVWIQNSSITQWGVLMCISLSASLSGGSTFVSFLEYYDSMEQQRELKALWVSITYFTTIGAVLFFLSAFFIFLWFFAGLVIFVISLLATTSPIILKCAEMCCCKRC